MYAKERILNCIKGKPIDRVPLSTYELCGYNFDAWENKEPSYRELMEVIRAKTDCLLMVDVGAASQQYNERVEFLSTRHQEDVITRTTLHTPKGDLTQTTQVKDRIMTTWKTEHLLKTIEDIDAYLSVDTSDMTIDFSPIIKASQSLGNNGVIMQTIGDPICSAAELFSMEDFLVYALTETDKMQYFLDVLHERGMAKLRKILSFGAEDMIYRICGPEYATPPYLPPELFYNFVTKYLIDMCHEIKQAGGIARIHSHGRVRYALEQFALTEASCVDPLEPLPDGDISLAEVKKLYGERFCLFGNIELKELEHASPARIDALVKQAMADAKEGGRFILMPTAAPINIPLSEKTFNNYIQFIESGLKYGAY